MHQLLRARLIDGTEVAVGEGTMDAIRCILEDEQGKKIRVVLKDCSQEYVAAEAIASLLLSGWGLPVPQPYLTLKQGKLCFASADVGYPNVLKFVGWSENHPPQAQLVLGQIAARIVLGLSSSSLAMACDEAIDNRDRNLGNVLWDGARESWIDHAYCFGLGLEQGNDNKLCAIAKAAGLDGAGALSAAMAMNRDLPEVVRELIRGSDIDSPSYLDLVVDKLNKIGVSLSARFPKPNDLFGQPI